MTGNRPEAYRDNLALQRAREARQHRARLQLGLIVLLLVITALVPSWPR